MEKESAVKWSNLTAEKQHQEFRVEVIFGNYADAVEFWMAAQNPDTKAIAGSIDYSADLEDSAAELA